MNHHGGFTALARRMCGTLCRSGAPGQQRRGGGEAAAGAGLPQQRRLRVPLQRAAGHAGGLHGGANIACPLDASKRKVDVHIDSKPEIRDERANHQMGLDLDQWVPCNPCIHVFGRYLANSAPSARSADPPHPFQSL